MYSECIKCPKIGISCDGPNFFAMNTQEILAWCKERKKELKASNAQLAEISGMPKGTIDRLFAGEHVDFRYETIRPLLKALTGGAWSGNPCATLEEDDALQKKIQELEAELARRDENIQQYKKNYDDLTTLVANTNKRHEEQLHFLRGEIKRKNKFVTGLAILSVLALLYIIVTLIIDLADSSQGFYWLEGLLHLPQGIIDQTGVNT
jgi:transcriptional regulator with XRE-family HTH domain